MGDKKLFTADMLFAKLANDDYLANNLRERALTTLSQVYIMYISHKYLCINELGAKNVEFLKFTSISY